MARVFVSGLKIAEKGIYPAVAQGIKTLADLTGFDRVESGKIRRIPDWTRDGYLLEAYFDSSYWTGIDQSTTET